MDPIKNTSEKGVVEKMPNISQPQVIYLPFPSKWRAILMVVGMVIMIILVLAVGAILKKLFYENTQLRAEVTEFKQLTDTLVRASAKWATKSDLEEKLKDMLTKEDREALERDLAALRASLVVVGKTVGSIGKKVSELEKSTSEGPQNPDVEQCADGRLIDVHGYTKAPQIKEVRDENEAPLASVSFDASKDKPWKYSVYERRFHLTTAVSRQENGQFAFHHTLDYDVPEKSDKKYKIKLTSSEYLQVHESGKMFWWNPIIDIGAFVGANVYSFAFGPGRSDGVFSFGAELGVSFSSYGYTRTDGLWRFFRLGLGYDAERRAGHLSFTPVTFNVGNPLPLLTNLWFYPHVSVDSGGGIVLGGGVGFQL